MDKIMEALDNIRIQLFCVGCTERMLVVHIFHHSFVCFAV